MSHGPLTADSARAGAAVEVWRLLNQGIGLALETRELDQAEIDRMMRSSAALTRKLAEVMAAATIAEGPPPSLTGEPDA